MVGAAGVAVCSDRIKVLVRASRSSWLAYAEMKSDLLTADWQFHSRRSRIMFWPFLIVPLLFKKSLECVCVSVSSNPTGAVPVWLNVGLAWAWLAYLLQGKQCSLSFLHPLHWAHTACSSRMLLGEVTCPLPLHNVQPDALGSASLVSVCFGIPHRESRTPKNGPAPSPHHDLQREYRGLRVYSVGASRQIVQKIVRTAEKIIGVPLPSVADIYIATHMHSVFFWGGGGCTLFFGSYSNILTQMKNVVRAKMLLFFILFFLCVFHKFLKSNIQDRSFFFAWFHRLQIVDHTDMLSY